MSKKKLVPKDKHATASWQKRNAARKAKQDAYRAARDADNLERALRAIQEGDAA